MGESRRPTRMLPSAVAMGVLNLSNYRLYRLDGAGKITAAEWIEAAEDADALRDAHGRVDGGSFELWQKDRLVERHRS